MYTNQGKVQKRLSLLLILTLVVTMVLPSFVFFTDTTPLPIPVNVSVSNQRVSMTEARDIVVTANFKTSVDPANLAWTFGDKDFSQWKKWDGDAGDFTGAPFISIAGAPTIDGTKVTATIKFDLPFDNTSLSTRSVRVQYPKLIGIYELKVTDKVSGETVSVPMKLNVYDDYHPYSEFKAVLDEIKKNAKADRYVEVTSLGKTADGEREQYFVIIAKSKAVVDNYLTKQVPEMINNPGVLQKKIQTQQGAKDYKAVIWFNNVHADEAVGPDANLQLASDFATKDTIKFDLKKAKVSEDFPKDKLLKVSEVLDNIILVFNITENPYGRDVNRRVNVNGIDLNRDYTYQTQSESQNFAKAFSKWVPLSLIDFHGFYSQFLIEPCTGPHNPNFEFDLLIDGLVGEAYAIGKVGVANTKYMSYDVPYLDYKDGFDDATPCYTSTYAIMQGTLGHTVEIPELNEDSYLACLYGGYGAINYVLERKAKLAYTQLEVFRRGIENIDNKEVDRFFTNSSGLVIGRTRTGNANYFPEYYVIPMDKDNQKNTYEATNIVNMLIRNGVKVQQLSADVKVGNVKYLAGSYVISMHQAKRSFANVVLSTGFDASDWNIMYAEIVNAFPIVRGFSVSEVRAPKAFDKNVKNIAAAVPQKTIVADAKSDYIIKNSSNQVPVAVNELLSSGKTVKIITSAANGCSAGDFLVSGADLVTVSTKYDLNIIKAAKAPMAKALKKTKVFLVKSSSSSYSAAKSNQTGFALAQLGFEVVDTVKACDVIVDNIGGSNADTDVIDAIKAGKPYIAIGGDSLYFVKDSKLMDGFDFVYKMNEDIGQPYEGVIKATMAKDNVICGGYGSEELLYSASGSWISKYPATATVLEKVVNRNDLFVAGWWPNHGELKNQVLGFQYKNMIIFANDLTNKDHTTNQFRLMANAIYAFQLK